jgi:rfaE bifunctional protein kinase chain/domain
MNEDRFESLTERYKTLRIAVLGDFCLDRYLEIDPSRVETSIETGLPVHNVVNLRAQPGGAGTILNNLSALGIGTIYPVGFAGDDGEGYELRRALAQTRGVQLRHFVQTPLRRTFTYCKPLVVEKGKPPRELNRLDSKNWTATPGEVEQAIIACLARLAGGLDAVVILDQVEVPGTGVVTPRVLGAIESISEENGGIRFLADSRRGLRDFPALTFKMNLSELAMFSGRTGKLGVEAARAAAVEIANKNGRSVFVTMQEQGIIGATPGGESEHVKALPVRGEIDVVGAGDAVSANIGAAIAAGATLREALELANAAASVVIHKLGTTGTATPQEIRALLKSSGALG